MPIPRESAPNPVAPRPIDLATEVDLSVDADLSNLDSAKIIAGPNKTEDRERWREQLTKWRSETRTRSSYNDHIYLGAELKSNPCYNLALVWLWDELLFDFATDEFTPEKLLADAERFGGFDGIILWHAYPVIGIDSRNQFDFYSDVIGLADLVAKFHDAKVKVFLNYNPWDRWTSRPPGSDSQELARIIETCNFDGVFLDTMKSAEAQFLEPMFQVNPTLIIGGESAVQLERIASHAISWAQWMADSEIPGVLRAHWFERRHIQHQVRRWNRSHLEELRISWLNGTGMLIWEVVFGTWVGWNDRDATLLREMVTYQRQFHNLLVEGEWTPLCDLFENAQTHGIFASQFESPEKTLWTIVNKSKNDYQGLLVEDLVGFVPAGGIAGVIKAGRSLRLLEFSFGEKNDEFPARETVRVTEKKSKTTGPVQRPNLTFSGELTYTYRNRECGAYGIAPFVDAWKPLPPDYHQELCDTESVHLPNFKIDEYEVSNAEFFTFLSATQFKPHSPHRFLQHWHNGEPVPGQEDFPVTYVDLADARTYAEWIGARLPTEWEWQYAASMKHIKRGSPTVWNLTSSEHSDGRTRFVILKGGSDYAAQGHDDRPPSAGILESDWYLFGGIRQPEEIEKLLLMGQGMSRSENIGFRCAYDV